MVVGRHEVNGKLLVPLETTGRRWQLNLRGGTPVEITAGGQAPARSGRAGRGPRRGCTRTRGAPRPGGPEERAAPRA